MNTMWNNYSVNKNHGSLIILECNNLLVSNMIAKLPLENLGRTYYAYINENIKLTLMVNGKLLKQIASNNVIDERNATYIKKNEIIVWKKEQELIVEFKNGNGTKVQFDLEDKKTKQTINLGANGYREIGKINFTSAIRYNPFDKADNWPVPDGGYYLQRGKKVINRIEIPYPTTGDFAYKDLRASSKHLVEFTTNLDSLFGIQVNKSKIDKHLIHVAIFKTLEHLAMDFCKKSWDKIKQPTTPVPVPVPVPLRPETPKPVPPVTPVTLLPPNPETPKPVPPNPASTFTFSQPNPILLPQPIPQQLPSIEQLIEASENYTKYLEYLKNLKNVETLKNSKTLQIYTLQCELKID